MGHTIFDTDKTGLAIEWREFRYRAKMFKRNCHLNITVHSTIRKQKLKPV